MINHRLLSLIRMEFIQIVRDARTLYIIFAIPEIQNILLGYTATTDVRNVPLAVFDQDHSPTVKELHDPHRGGRLSSVVFDVPSEVDLRRLIDDGPVRVGMFIPPRINRARSCPGKRLH